MNGHFVSFSKKCACQSSGRVCVCEGHVPVEHVRVKTDLLGKQTAVIAVRELFMESNTRPSQYEQCFCISQYQLLVCSQPAHTSVTEVKLERKCTEEINKHRQTRSLKRALLSSSSAVKAKTRSPRRANEGKQNISTPLFIYLILYIYLIEKYNVFKLYFSIVSV
ncbi:hypothetical protein WMY93_005607 [Mugilogobius chulae]|uniref:Uncharacterized protein n=1 Tax=Mugilogobius chulae TaxID=88201 RepID=A0AAW0PHJ9_9GOBI